MDLAAGLPVEALVMELSVCESEGAEVEGEGWVT